MDRDKVICRCFKVTAGAIEDAVKSGATTFEEVQAETNCSNGCGCCESEVRDIIDKLTK